MYNVENPQLFNQIFGEALKIVNRQSYGIFVLKNLPNFNFLWLQLAYFAM